MDKKQNLREHIPISMQIRSKLKRSMLYRFLPSRVFWQPRSINIGLTTVCNLKCVMCPREAYTGGTGENELTRNQNMTMETFLNVAKNLKGKGLGIVAMGESMMHPRLFDMIDEAYKNGAKETGFVTNGTLMNENMAKKIIEHKVSNICISIDGTKELYERVRGQNAYDTIVNNLKRLHELKKEYKSKTPGIYINFVGMRMNIQDAPKVLKSVFQYTDNFGVMHPYLMRKDLWEQHLMNGETESTEKIFDEIRELGKELGVGIQLRPVVPIIAGCLEPWGQVYVGFNGNVFACTFTGSMSPMQEFNTYYEDTFVHIKMKNYLLGNINEIPLRDMWNGEKIIGIRKNLKKLFKVDMGKALMPGEYTKMGNEDHEASCRLCPYRMALGA